MSQAKKGLKALHLVSKRLSCGGGGGGWEEFTAAF